MILLKDAENVMDGKCEKRRFFKKMETKRKDNYNQKEKRWGILRPIMRKYGDFNTHRTEKARTMVGVNNKLE